MRSLTEKAIPKFEPERGFQFTTYAHAWVKQGVRRAVQNTSTRLPFRIPVHAYEYQATARHVTRTLANRLDRHPTPEEVLEFLDQVKTRGKRQHGKKLRRWVFQHERSYPLDAPVSRDDTSTRHEIMEFEYGAFRTPEEELYLVETRRRVKDELRRLESRTREIIARRYGLGFEDHTLEEVGVVFAITRERVRQVELKALQTLGKRLGMERPELIGTLKGLGNTWPQD